MPDMVTMNNMKFVMTVGAQKMFSKVIRYDTDLKKEKVKVLQLDCSSYIGLYSRYYLVICVFPLPPVGFYSC